MTRIASLPTARTTPAEPPADTSADMMATTAATMGKRGVSWINAAAATGPGTVFYALLPGGHITGTTVVPVIDSDGDQMLHDEILLVTTDPRRLPITEAVGVLDPGTYQIMDLRGLLARGDRLARLAPVGPVIPTDTDLPHLHMSPQGWTITGRQPVDAVLGPQADQLRAAVARFEDPRGSGPAAMAYARAVNAQHSGRDWAGTPHADAAQAALEDAGVDGQWWRYVNQSCGMGAELLALAARDLIGTTPGWTWPAYAVLVEPWRKAYGWPHPDDAAALRAVLQAAAEGRPDR